MSFLIKTIEVCKVSQTVSKQDVLHIATLARLKFDDGQAERFTNDLNNILGYIEKLNELNTDNIEPTSHALDVFTVTREDKAAPSLSNEDAVRNAPKSENGMFRVPKVIE
ncbi:Asp-tRNA(Asn)/Glu-tRNA(Gln) amidotransferase subunit GatC [Seleniivibrio woodruffii]|uniref:Asp-tRNA(Asn)/Glu-tRNA(Gln) amidotransferase subunit GatC n=1 Tax=Seleniivibrio woodruffii TaxID=1078050 RepID=UPI002409F071|nr:Asp-tRNA(Asn)/Glu-tRNA(Gln) amidotransferase subunit GatC [Seleniivibrio woodruffii]